MTFWAVVFIVLMLIWLFGGCIAYWPAGTPPGVAWGPFGAHFLCWCCVAILGYIVLTGEGRPIIPR